mgnify:CR=1 FL=1
MTMTREPESGGPWALRVWPVLSSVIAAILGGMLVYAGVQRELAAAAEGNQALRGALAAHEQIQTEQQRQIREDLAYIRSRVDRLTELQQQQQPEKTK